MGLVSANPGTEKSVEPQRLALLAALEILDSPAERVFDTIAAAAQRTLRCPIALISLIDDSRQWFKAKCGLEISETPRDQAFCAHAVAADALLVVRDAAADPRFADNPMVVGPPYIRFYAGVPVRLRAADDADTPLPMGTLCVIDHQPRDLSATDIEHLHDLANLVETLLAARAAAQTAMRLADERQTVLHALDRSHRQFRQAERMANIGSWRLTLADKNTEWSDQVYTIHGLLKGADTPLLTALDFYPPRSREAIEAALTATIESGKPFTLETDFLTAQGEKRRIRTMGELELRGGEPVAVIGVFQDITSRYAMEQALRITANIDDLTQLANRAWCNEVIDEQLAAARAREAPLALLLIDLDHFKSVNDRCGHLAGDALLQRVAARLSDPCLDGSFAARIGGDEFVLVVTAPHLLADLPATVARLLAALHEKVDLGGVCVEVSGTIGVAMFEADVIGRSDLLHRADIALYEAKRARRGAAKLYGEARLITPTDAVRGLRAVS